MKAFKFDSETMKAFKVRRAKFKCMRGSAVRRQTRRMISVVWFQGPPANPTPDSTLINGVPSLMPSLWWADDPGHIPYSRSTGNDETLTRASANKHVLARQRATRRCFFFPCDSEMQNTRAYYGACSSCTT